MNINFQYLNITVLKAPGMQPLKVCLMKPHEVADGVSIWEWSGSAWYEGAEAAQWFSDYLGKPSSLIRFNTGKSLNLCILTEQDNEKKNVLKLMLL